MQTALLLLTFLSFNYLSFAQSPESTQTTELTSLTKLEVGAHGIGFGYEIPFMEKWTLNLSAGLGGGYYSDNFSDVEGFHSTWIINEPVAYFRSEIKYVYNREKRLLKSKSILNNAGNYVAFQTKYTTRRVFESSDWSY